MRGATGWLLPLLTLTTTALHAQPETLVPREPLASLRVDHPREAGAIAPFFATAGDAPLWPAVGLPPLEGLDLDAPWYLFLAEGDDAPRLSALVPVTDPEAFERSLLGARQGVGFDREGRHALVGILPLPRTGGTLPSHRPGEAIEIVAHPGRILAAYREAIETFFQERAAQAPRLAAEARGELYRPAFALDGLREAASSDFGTIADALEQLKVVHVQAKLASGLAVFDATLTFEPGSDIAGTLDEQPLSRPSRLLDLDPDLPYHEWSNLRLAGNPTLRRLAALWTVRQAGVAVESAEKLVVDAERILGSGSAITESELEIMAWPSSLSMSDYRSLVAGHAADTSNALGLQVSYAPEVRRSDELVVDRVSLSNGSGDAREALARVETYFGWTGTKLVVERSLSDAPEAGLARLEAALSREPEPERRLDALLSSTPGELMWLSRFDLASWDRLVQRHVPAADRLEPLGSPPERPLFLLYATAYSGTLELGGWVDPLQQAAMQARLEAVGRLAERYYERGHSAGDEAHIWYGRAARLGHASGQIAFGWLNESGQGIPQSFERAAHWYRMSAAQGEPTGALDLGYLYHRGRGGARDDEKARFWFGMAAALGNAEGQYRLGTLYENGEGVEKDPKVALDWYLRAGEQGYARAQNAAGILYHEGEGVSEDLNEAERWYRMAAEQGHVSAMANLGDLLLYDRSDPVQGVEWLRKAAAKGNAYGRYHLARALEDGRGVQRDVDAAMEIFTLLAGEPGDYQHLAQYRRALLLEKDHPEESLTALREAADGGLVRAQLRLYRVLFEGRGAVADPDAALGWLRKAAENDVTAAGMLGWHLMTGNGTAKDEQAAVKLFARAAEGGVAQAQFSLASAYELGQGVEQNWSEAARWHRAAAEQGHAMSQVRLGGQYLSGNGVDKDLVESYAWLTLAQESRDEEASALAVGVMKALTPSMSAEQIERGKELAAARRHD